MSAAVDLLQAATAAGAKFTVSRDRVIVRAPQPLAPELLDELRRAKHEILRLLAVEPGAGNDRRLPEDAAWWCHHFTIRTIHWELGAYRSHLEAQCLAFGELLDEFRENHGRRWPAWQCAGCDEPIGGLSAQTLGDGNRVHFDEKNQCLIRYGRRWRGDAIAGLRAMGLDPPPGFEPQ
jgi:hypothetical protein